METIIEIELPEGGILLAEVTEVGPPGDREATDVGLGKPYSPEKLAKTVEGLATVLSKSFSRVKPSKATIEFGLDLKTRSGELVAMLVDVDVTASIKVTLEWQYSQQ